MAAKKKSLPEHSTTNPELVTLAKTALELRNKISLLEADLATAKKDLGDKAKELRATEEAGGNYVGLIRIADGEQSPCQVQFKIMNGSLAITDKAKLDDFLGAASGLLFAKDSAVDEIIDPAALIAWLVAKGIDPWTVLELKVKKDMDAIVLECPSLTKVEAMMPREGFLATCNEFVHTFSENAKTFLKNYLVKVLSVAVDLGKK